MNDKSTKIKDEQIIFEARASDRSNSADNQFTEDNVQLHLNQVQEDVKNVIILYNNQDASFPVAIKELAKKLEVMIPIPNDLFVNPDFYQCLYTYLSNTTNVLEISSVCRLLSLILCRTEGFSDQIPIELVSLILNLFYQCTPDQNLFLINFLSNYLADLQNDAYSNPVGVDINQNFAEIYDIIIRREITTSDLAFFRQIAFRLSFGYKISMINKLIEWLKTSDKNLQVMILLTLHKYFNTVYKSFEEDLTKSYLEFFTPLLEIAIIDSYDNQIIGVTLNIFTVLIRLINEEDAMKLAEYIPIKQILQYFQSEDEQVQFQAVQCIKVIATKKSFCPLLSDVGLDFIISFSEQSEVTYRIKFFIVMIFCNIFSINKLSDIDPNSLDYIFDYIISAADEDDPIAEYVIFSFWSTRAYIVIRSSEVDAKIFERLLEQESFQALLDRSLNSDNPDLINAADSFIHSNQEALSGKVSLDDIDNFEQLYLMDDEDQPNIKQVKSIRFTVGGSS